MSEEPPPPLVEELTEVPDPLDACVCFADLPYVLLLDSVASPERLGRHSFLAADPVVVVRSKNGRTERADRRIGGRWSPIAADPLDAVRELLAPHATVPVPGLPPFQGGAAGYIGYDWGARLERIPQPRYDDLAVPDVLLGLYDWVVAWDHHVGRAWIISTGVPDRDGARRAAARMAWARERLRRPGGATPARTVAPSDRAARQRAPSYPLTDTAAAVEIGLRSNFTRDGYLQAVARVIEYIHAGDLFQANLSQRLEVKLAEPPLTLYRRLRLFNPAPFAAYFDCGDLIVASSSPERFLQVHEGRGVEARPIKGTRPRGVSPEHDAALGLALTESEKDRAENVMIVDLLRNDLSRVCVPGTVRAPELFTLEHYATVHHLVSTVVGELAPEHDVVDLLRAAFPGGSITGAPKIRAMQIIAELEPTQRAVYCGSLGYLSRTGALDTSIAIRTYLILGDDVYFQVGGGIVADSDPEQEYWETLHKGQGLVAALASAPPPTR
ncbi:MAG TPA: aminodeoxychorismate synthase component I [Gemmatimonadales bacterium]|nr:aminodeoxychorismate synthase component I [Gemmatimonadales bacterium]